MSEFIDGQAPKSFPAKRMIGTALGVILLVVVPCRASTSATSNSSDWFGADSGWKSESENFFDSPPEGSFKESYRHWFDGVKPAATSLRGTPAKPSAAMWATTPAIAHAETTTSPAGSTATSEWNISTYRRSGDYKVEYKTRSTANAKKPDTSAHSETFVTDPWLIEAPSLNPDWPALPLDPLGRWTHGMEVLLTGALSTADGSTQLGVSYRAAFNSSDPLSSEEILRIDISGLGATMVANPNLHLYFAGVEKSPSEVAAVLDSFLTPTGWFLDPGFDLKTFDFTNQSHLAQVFQLNAAMFLDDETARSATIFTEAFTAASSAVPEPSTYALLSLGLLGIWLFRVQSHRKKL